MPIEHSQKGNTNYLEPTPLKNPTQNTAPKTWTQIARKKGHANQLEPTQVRKYPPESQHENPGKTHTFEKKDSIALTLAKKRENRTKRCYYMPERKQRTRSSKNATRPSRS